MQAIESETIERAFKAIEVAKLTKDGKVSSEVMGYVSSFGAAVIQAGLVAAVIFFSEESKDKDAKDRPKVIQALYYMIKAEKEAAKPTTVSEVPQAQEVADSPSPETIGWKEKLIDYLRANPTDLDVLEERLLANAVALKMALRSYEKIDVKSGNQP